jgi:hypothetical protein
MGSSAALLMNASVSTENLQVRAARAEMEMAMLQADLAPPGIGPTEGLRRDAMRDYE